MTASMRRLASGSVLGLCWAAIVAPPASAHTLPKSVARDTSNTLMKRICHEDPRPCRGWEVSGCARKSSHRVDCKAAHMFIEEGRDKTCRMWVTSQLSHNLIRTHILRATVRCEPD